MRFFHDTFCEFSYKSRVPLSQCCEATFFCGSVSGTLILVPPSLVGQWESEFLTRHTGPLRLCKYYGTNRPRSAQALLAFDVVLTTFTLINRDTLLSGFHWHRVVVVGLFFEA